MILLELIIVISTSGIKVLMIVTREGCQVINSKLVNSPGESKNNIKLLKRAALVMDLKDIGQAKGWENNWKDISWFEVWILFIKKSTFLIY